MHYTIQKVINKNPYLFGGDYDKNYVNKPVYMAKYDGCQIGEEIYSLKLKQIKSWLK
jgi:hypothetical protein